MEVIVYDYGQTLMTNINDFEKETGKDEARQSVCVKCMKSMLLRTLEFGIREGNQWWFYWTVKGSNLEGLRQN